MLLNDLKQGEWYFFPKWFEKMYDTIYITPKIKTQISNIAGKPLFFIGSRNFKYNFLCEGIKIILSPSQITHLEVFNLDKEIKNKQKIKHSTRTIPEILNILKNRYK